MIKWCVKHRRYTYLSISRRKISAQAVAGASAANGVKDGLMIAAVPEPGTTALCGVGLLLVVRRFGARGTALAAVERGLSRVAEFVTSDGAWLRT